MEKKVNVPLDEALQIAGTGLYSYYIVFTTGFILFTGMMNVEAMSIVLPAAGCELNLTNSEKGMLASMLLAGMLCAGPTPGFLADAYGRTRVTFWGQAMCSLLLFLSSMAPNTATLMVLCFANGLAATAAFTPTYVLVSEFCPVHIRARALIFSTCMSAMANVVLPGLAWLVMPLDIRISIPGFITFTSWRLFLALLTIPMIMGLCFVWKIPETPKFQLNEGKALETLEILKTIFAVNNKKSRDEYPVLSVILDSSDEGFKINEVVSNPLLQSMKEMWSRTRLLFSRRFVLNTTITCIIFFTQVGVYYVYILWLPEQLSRIKQYSYSNEVYNVTLCDLMSTKSSAADITADCQLNYDFFSYCIILGVSQVAGNLCISGYADRIGKKLLLTVCLVASAAGGSTLLFLRMEYVTIGMIVFSTVVISMSFSLMIALVMEYYPTYVRSTASAVGMIFGRLGGTAGSQIVGLLFEINCQSAYYGTAGILIATAMLCLVLPSRRKS